MSFEIFRFSSFMMAITAITSFAADYGYCKIAADARWRRNDFTMLLYFCRRRHSAL